MMMSGRSDGPNDAASAAADIPEQFWQSLGLSVLVPLVPDAPFTACPIETRNSSGFIT